jgi:hypothetical protein
MFDDPPPDDKHGIWHLPTLLYYMKYIMLQNNDEHPVWITEFNWPGRDAKNKAKYLEKFLDICRKSGVVERVNYYMAIDPKSDLKYRGIWPKGMILVDRLGDTPEDIDENTAKQIANLNVPIGYTPTEPYYKFREYTEKYPVWDKSQIEILDIITPADSDAVIINHDFESGDKTGWKGDFIIDSKEKHTGNFAAKIYVSSGSIISEQFNVEPNKLYELSFWIKVNTEKIDDGICLPGIEYIDKTGEIVVPEVLNCWGIVDTRRYPNGWRKMVIPIMPVDEYCRLKFEFQGKGEMFVDDIKMVKLDLKKISSLIRP